jgi:hypothetical protein
MLAAAVGLVVASVFLACAYPAPPDLWGRLDFNEAPFEDFIGPYFETARTAPSATQPAQGYHYPALLALLLAPLARLGPEVASYVWLALLVLATCVVITAPLVHAPPRRSVELGVFVALAALSHPLVHDLYWGQISTPLAALLLVAVLLTGRGRARLGAALVGLCTALKLTPVLFLLGPLARGERRTALFGAAVAAFLITVPALVWMGPDTFVAFHATVLERLVALGARVGEVEGGRGSQDLAAACARWLGGGHGFVIGRLVGLALAAALVVRSSQVRDAGLVYAHLALLAPLVVAPTWSHGLAALPAAAWFVWRDGGATRASRTCAVAALALTSMPVHALFAGPEAHARSGVGALAVVALALALLARRSDADAAERALVGPVGLEPTTKRL